MSTIVFELDGATIEILDKDTSMILSREGEGTGISNKILWDTIDRLVKEYI